VYIIFLVDIILGNIDHLIFLALYLIIIDLICYNALVTFLDQALFFGCVCGKLIVISS